MVLLLYARHYMYMNYLINLLLLKCILYQKG